MLRKLIFGFFVLFASKFAFSTESQLNYLKEAFYEYCTSFDSKYMLRTVFGNSEYFKWCNCAFDRTAEVIDKSKIKKILFHEIGLIDPDYSKFIYKSINNIADCTSSTSTPIKLANEILKNYYDYLKVTATIDGRGYVGKVMLDGLAIDLEYSVARSSLLSNGWKPYIRTDSIARGDKEYPEVDMCDEDACTSFFISTVDTTKVRKIDYIICSPDRYYPCPDKPGGFKKITNDLIEDRADSDKNFTKMKELLLQMRGR